MNAEESNQLRIEFMLYHSKINSPDASFMISSPYVLMEF